MASKYPLFGTGVETFAYSYNFVRPLTHNLTSEWDYVYNKAHNEYFNYLATTGFIGLISYLFIDNCFYMYFEESSFYLRRDLEQTFLILKFILTGLAYKQSSLPTSLVFRTTTIQLFFF